MGYRHNNQCAHYNVRERPPSATGRSNTLGMHRDKIRKQWNRVWHPGKPFGLGRKLQDPVSGPAGTRRNPRIIWQCHPKKYDWHQKLHLTEEQKYRYVRRHEEIARQECLRWGWRYVLIRKELHSTNKEGKLTDPHITVYLSMTPNSIQVEGHWFCYESRRMPGYPIAIMRDGDVALPKRVPSRELYPIGYGLRNEYLPEEWESSHRPPTAATFAPAFKRPVPQVDFTHPVLTQAVASKPNLIASSLSEREATAMRTGKIMQSTLQTREVPTKRKRVPDESDPSVPRAVLDAEATEKTAPILVNDGSQGQPKVSVGKTISDLETVPGRAEDPPDNSSAPSPSMPPAARIPTEPKSQCDRPRSSEITMERRILTPIGPKVSLQKVRDKG